MAEYLVRISTPRPDTLSDAEWDVVVAAERVRGTELRRAGVIREIWRVAGSQANVGIWAAATPDELHAAIASLPAFRWMSVEITALSRHPLSPVD